MEPSGKVGNGQRVLLRFRVPVPAVELGLMRVARKLLSAVASRIIQVTQRVSSKTLRIQNGLAMSQNLVVCWVA